MQESGDNKVCNAVFRWAPAFPLTGEWAKAVIQNSEEENVTK